MGKKLFYFLLILFLISLLVGPFFIKQKNDVIKNNKKQRQQHSQHLEEIDKDIEKLILTWEKSKNKQNLTDSLNFSLTWVIKEVSLKDLKKYYSEARIKWDENLKIKMLEKIYQKTWDKFVLKLLIDNYLNINAYKSAYDYLKVLYKEDKKLWDISINKFFFIMFNALDLNKDNLKKIKWVLESYFEKWEVSDNDYYFYKSILELIKLDLNKFENSVQKLESKKYKDFKKDLNDVSTKYKSYKDSPEYYYYGLLSFVMFQYKYFGVAEKLANESLKFNENYVLPYQVLAYSNFTKQDWKKSSKYLKKLIKLDYKNSSLYKLFLWISHYRNWNYEDAVTFLTQIDNSVYIKDVYRYLILSYRELWDKNKTINYYEKLLDFQNLSEHDMYSFFNMFVYLPREKWKDFQIFKNNKDLYKKYLVRCYKNFRDDYLYICRYWKAGYHIAKDEVSKAFAYLEYLADYYPRGYIFEILWKRYFKMQKYDEAKKNYVKAIIHSSEDQKRQILKEKIVDIVLEKKKKLEK